jgi:hypothetical protein
MVEFNFVLFLALHEAVLDLFELESFGAELLAVALLGEAQFEEEGADLVVFGLQQTADVLEFCGLLAVFLLD